MKILSTLLIAFSLPISLFATVNLTATVTNNICYNGTAGSIKGLASGGSSGQYEYQLAGNAGGWVSSSTFSSLAAGTYPLTARDKNNTTDLVTIFVTVSQPTDITVSSSVTNTTCATSSDGGIILTVSGGTSPYSYAWTKNGTSISGATGSSITGLQPGVYNAVITDVNGCQQQLTNASSTAIVPLTLTGFNQDVIANGTNTSTATNTTVTSPMDTSSSGFPGHNLYAYGFKPSSSSTALTANALPANGIIKSAFDNTHQFVLADYSASNGLYLNSSSASKQAGTLTLASSSIVPYQNLYILASGAFGAAPVNYSVNYSDGTTSSGSISITDWYSGNASVANAAFGPVANVSYIKNGSNNAGTLGTLGTNFYLYDLPISLAANTKNVVSITFTNTNNNSKSIQADIFAITGATSSIGVAVLAGSATTPSVSIVPNPSNLSYCSGESFTFTAAPTDAGSTQSYVWKIGSTTQSSTNSSMTATITGSGSQTVSVTMTVTDATATCLTTQTATQTINLTSASITPSVSVSGPSSICQGSSTTYIATPVNGGATPTYAWYVNGSLVTGNTNPTFTNALSNTGTNSIYAKLTSSVSCAASNPATSTTVATTVNATVTPSATINAKSTKSGTNTNVTFSIASSANLGSSPSYQWYLNGNPIANGTSSTCTVTNPLPTDSYSVAVVSSATCPTNAQIMSNYVSVNISLPIILDWFKVTLQNSNNAMLSWHTTSENNVKTIKIQRSPSSTNSFATIGAVLPTNNVNGSTYNYLDTLGVIGNYFYRLKTTDLDGTFTYSDIVSVTVNKGISTSVIVYPNPFSDELHLQISSSQSIQNASFTLYNIAGQAIFATVKNISVGSQIIDFQGLNKLPSGIYMLKLNGAGIGNNVIKIIKK